jgi:hypothetical protein
MQSMTMTRSTECSAVTVHLLVAFELGQRWWKVGFTTGLGRRPRTRRIAAGAVAVLVAENSARESELRARGGRAGDQLL